MFKVLIVDDNAIIRKSLIARVNWNEIEMEVVGEACDGKEALDIIFSSDIDIVITDIKMPKIDGLSLIEKTRDHFPNMQYIIISSFDDFKYTKKAILYKVINYILKPINNHELIAALEASKKNILELQEQQLQETNIKSSRDINNFSKVNARIISYLNNSHSKETITSIFDSLNIITVNKKITMIAVNTVYNTLDITQVYTINKKLSFKYHKDNRSLLTIRLTGNIFIIIILSEEISTLIVDKIVMHSTKILNSMHYSNIYFGSSTNELEKIKKCFIDATHALYYRFLDIPSKNGVFYHFNIEATDLPDEKLNSFKIALNLGIEKQVKEIINRIFSQLDVLQINLFILLMRSITNIIHNSLLLNNLEKSILKEEVFNRYFLLKFHELKDIKQYYINLSKTVCDSIKANQAEPSDKIIGYIKTNFAKSITLNSIAEKFYMNTNYLGQIIKKETGQTFNQFINSLRIDQAKDILSKQPNIKLNDLAHSIGYADAQYFSKVFRKIAGCTPTQYKNM